MSSKVKVAVRVRPFNRRGKLSFSMVSLENSGLRRFDFTQEQIHWFSLWFDRNWDGHKVRRRYGWNTNHAICRWLTGQVRALLAHTILALIKAHLFLNELQGFLLKFSLRYCLYFDLFPSNWIAAAMNYLVWSVKQDYYVL